MQHVRVVRAIPRLLGDVVYVGMSTLVPYDVTDIAAGRLAVYGVPLISLCLMAIPNNFFFKSHHLYMPGSHIIYSRATAGSSRGKG